MIRVDKNNPDVTLVSVPVSYKLDAEDSVEEPIHALACNSLRGSCEQQDGIESGISRFAGNGGVDGNNIA